MSIMDKLKEMFSGGSSTDDHRDREHAAAAETPVAAPMDQPRAPMPEAGAPHTSPPAEDRGDQVQ